MLRVALAVVVLALLLGGIYRAHIVPSIAWKTAAPPTTSSKRVVPDTGCSGTNSITFDLSAATVGVPIEGRVGSHSACEGKEIERMSGDIDWGDETSSPINAGDFRGNDKNVLLVGRHEYATAGTFALFARIRAQCDDHGQSTRVITCGSGTLEVK